MLFYQITPAIILGNSQDDGSKAAQSKFSIDSGGLDEGHLVPDGADDIISIYSPKQVLWR